ncbi:MAG: hypothetical protein WBQ04_20210 [Candidatus Acidiferrales bacterium]
MVAVKVGQPVTQRCYVCWMATLIRMAALSKVFFTSGYLKDAHARMARLCVLYEDLRIEVKATAERSIPFLDVTCVQYRENYFLRRSIATLVEFAEAIRLLDECVEFQPIKKTFPTELKDRWKGGVRFFREREQFFEKVRNDVGGHFGLPAALFAIEHREGEAVEAIESSAETTIRLPFATDLVATALTRHLDGSSAEEKFSGLFKDIETGFRHATDCTHCVVFGYLWERFGK